jgi:hypothetical protein
VTESDQGSSGRLVHSVGIPHQVLCCPVSAADGWPGPWSSCRQEGGEGKRRSSLGEEEDFKGYEEQYPQARGLVGRK